MSTSLKAALGGFALAGLLVACGSKSNNDVSTASTTPLTSTPADVTTSSVADTTTSMAGSSSSTDQSSSTSSSDSSATTSASGDTSTSVAGSASTAACPVGTWHLDQAAREKLTNTLSPGGSTSATSSGDLVWDLGTDGTWTLTPKDFQVGISIAGASTSATLSGFAKGTYTTTGDKLSAETTDKSNLTVKVDVGSKTFDADQVATAVLDQIVKRDVSYRCTGSNLELTAASGMDQSLTWVPYTG